MNDPWAQLEAEFSNGKVTPQQGGDPWAQLEAEFTAPKQQPQLVRQAQPAPTSRNADGWRGTALGGMARGARDLMDGGAQLLTRGVEGVASMSGIKGFQDWASAERQNVENINAEAEREYKQEWRPELEGLDWGRMGGQAAATLPFTPARVATLPQAIGAGARSGAAIGALQKVEKPDDGYWAKKAGQTIVSGAVGGAVPAAIGGVQSGVSNLRNAFSGGGKAVDQAAAQRIAEAKALGIDLTKGQASRNPQQWAFEHNAKGLEGAGMPIAERFNSQNARLIELLNQQGAGKSGGSYNAGVSAMEALAGRDAARKGAVDAAYTAARDSAGIGTALNGARLMNDVAVKLDDALLGDAVPSSIRNIINKFGQGEASMTIGKAEQVIRAINGHYGTDPVTNRALGMVKEAIENEISATGSTLGQQTAGAFQAARASAASRFNWHDAVPAAKAVASGELVPDTFIQKYVVGASTQSAANTMKALPLAERETVRNAILETIKNKALSGASDETGTFSQAAYNKTLQSIGRAKLGAVLGKQRTEELFKIGRVAENMIRSPGQAAVNRSNTSSTLMNMLARSTNIPIIGPNITRPIDSLMMNQRVGQSLAPNAGMYLNPASNSRLLEQTLGVAPYIGGAATGGLFGAAQ